MTSVLIEMHVDQNVDGEKSKETERQTDGPAHTHLTNNKNITFNHFFKLC